MLLLRLRFANDKIQDCKNEIVHFAFLESTRVLTTCKARAGAAYVREDECGAALASRDAGGGLGERGG